MSSPESPALLERPEGPTAGTAAPRCPYGAMSLDLINPLLYADGDPHTLWRALRAHDPVHWESVATDDGEQLGYWSVTRFADAEFVLREHTLFTSQRGTLLTLLGTDDPAGGRQMAATDPPLHGRMRDPLQRAMTIKSVTRHSDAIETEVGTLLDRWLDGGVHDMAATMAELPMAVTGNLMGLPRADWPELTRLTWMAIAPDDPGFQLPEGAEATLQSAHRELFAYFHDQVGVRSRQPGDDLISTLLGMEVDGRPLRAGEIVSNCYSLLLGANVTTPHVPVAALRELMADPARYDDWAAHPELLHSGVEEALRWSSPANHFMRYATADTVIRDRPIRAGDAVVVWLGSANRDEDVFADPDVFDVRRRPNRHIAFGAGPHYCIGHTVARLTLRILMRQIFERFEGFEPAGPPQGLVSNFVAGLTSLPVTVRPRSRPVSAL